MSKKQKSDLSPLMRRKLGLQNISLSPVQVSEIKKGLSEKGFEAEKRFLEAWNDPSIFPDWFVLVRAATHIEDTQQKTDAVIMTTGDRMLRIQIKTNKVISKKRRNWFYREGLVLLQIFDEDTPERIRIETLIAIEDFHRYRANQPPNTLK